MLNRGPVVVAFVLLMLASGTFVSSNFASEYVNPRLANGTDDDTSELAPIEDAQLSDQRELEGTIDPVVIEQTGNKTTETLHAETDSKTNVKTNLSIDTANDWVGSRASVNLWNLERLYVENGSLTEGIEGETKDPTGSVLFYPYGWDAISYNGSDADMETLAGYTNQEIVVTGNGYGGGGNYFYVNGSYVYWTQTVNNTPYLENFILNFNYLYDRGPEANSNVTLRVYADDRLIWSNTTETIPTSIWYNSGDILVDLDGAGSEFEFKIGLYFDGDFYHSQQFIGFKLDNIRFVGEPNPTFDDVGITLNIGQESAAITGTSVGYASITNSSLWRTDRVLIEFTADLSYSFDYTATMLNSRYINSTRSTTLLDEGVYFTSEGNSNSLLEFYTFVGAIPDIDDFTLVIRVPLDWENVSVFNPYGTPVTSSCVIQAGIITIPNSLLYTLGWWEIKVESPNYVRNLQTLKLNELALTWLPDTVFRSTNITKPTIEIGGTSPIPGALQNVNITWFMPNGTSWFSELLSGGTNGEINGSQLEFGPVNATAGLWRVSVFWTNGSEIAFSHVHFEVYHATTLSAHESNIETESGLSVSNFVYYQDSENGEFLMNPAASITANWSSTTVIFILDLIHNRWVGTFDTSLVGPGNHLVVVNASRPYFDDVSCTFLVTIILTDNDLTIDNPTAELGIGDTYLATFSYSDYYGVGIPDANASIEFSGIADGITWGELNHLGGGDYSIEFTAVYSGSYVVTIDAFKQYYESASDSFYILVRDITTNFTVLNGTAGIVSYGNDYNLILSYTNGTGWGIEDANITIESVVPETGLSWGTVTPGDPGIYSIVLTPGTSNTFTILVRASKPNHQVQFVSFTITATAIASSLTVLNASTTISFDQNYTVYMYYQSEDLIGLEYATLSVQNPPTEVSFTSFIELGDGYYKVTMTPNEIGIFDLVFRAELTGYQSDSAGFALSASRIRTELRFDSGLSSDTIQYLQTSELIVIFERTDINQTISGADITIQMSPSTGIEWAFHEEGGAYHILVESDRVGRWIMTISATKTGYALGSVQFILDVEPVRVEAELLTLPSNVEGEEFLIEIALTLEGTTTPVEGALVEFRMTVFGNPAGTYETMEETDIPGVYRVTYIFPLYQSTSEYELEIRVSKDNYELAGGTFTSLFSKSEDVVLRMIPIATGSGLLIVLIVGSVIGYRVNNTRKRRRNLEAHQVKARFDDVSNILGIIVLHKTSGLPVYSKILKGGFEEAMVSAFITAITHFRSEFEMDEKHWEFNVIPISDIISAVPTKSLIVAFITVRSPSKFQEVGMEAFGRAAGAMFDEVLADSKSTVEDMEQTKILDTLFYDLLDGFLIERFRTSKYASFPKSMKCLEDAALQLENGEGFKLEDLAKEMATCGIEESHAYKIVMDAIDDDLIEMANGNAPESTDNVANLFVDRKISDSDDEDEFTT